MQAGAPLPALEQAATCPEPGRVVRLTWPIRLLVFPLLIGSISKRALGFAFLRGPVHLAFGVVLLGLALWVGVLTAPLLGWGAYVLAAWLVGTPGALLTLNTITDGFIFVRPFCARCELAPIILQHEALHLRGLARERDVWVALRRRFGSDATCLKDPAAICAHCPIPVRLAGPALRPLV